MYDNEMDEELKELHDFKTRTELTSALEAVGLSSEEAETVAIGVLDQDFGCLQSGMNSWLQRSVSREVQAQEAKRQRADRDAVTRQGKAEQEYAELEREVAAAMGL